MKFHGYPFSGNYREVNGWRMHYLDEGGSNTDILVMVHGNPSWSYLYRNPVLALRDRYRCIVPDHIGMGLSEKPESGAYPYLLSNRIDDLEELLAQVAPDARLSLLMHDWGGMIGMGYAARHPGRIRRLVFMNTAAFHLPAGSTIPWQIRLARCLLAGPLLVRGFNAFCLGALRLGTVRPLASDEKNAYLAPYDSWANRVAVQRFVEDIPLEARHPSYAEVSNVAGNLGRFRDLPVLLCWGLRDFVFDHHYLKIFREHFPDACCRSWENAGHYLLEDAGAEVLAEIRHFLDTSP